VVFDLVGGEIQTHLLQVLRHGGKLISAVSKPDQALAASHGVSAAFFLVDVTTERLSRIDALSDCGELRTHLGAVLTPAGRCTRYPHDAGGSPTKTKGQDRPACNVERSLDVNIGLHMATTSSIREADRCDERFH
jgi:hypothetical protein